MPHSKYFQPVLWASAPHPRPMAILINNHGTTHQGKSASHNLKGKTNLRNWLTMQLKDSIHRLLDAELQETTQLVQSHGPPIAIPERRSMLLKGLQEAGFLRHQNTLLRESPNLRHP